MAASSLSNRRKARPKACRACGETYRPTANSKRCALCRRPLWPHCRLYIIACGHCGQTVVSGDRRRRYCRGSRCRNRHSDAVIVGRRQCVMCRDWFVVSRRQERDGKLTCGDECLSYLRADKLLARLAAA